MEIVFYSGHVKVSSLGRGSPGDWKKAGRSRSRPSMRPDLEPPRPGRGPIGSS
jgi:hypothetical protein